MRRLFFGVFAVLIAACNGDHASNSTAPTGLPMTTVLIGMPSLVNNPFVPASGQSPAQFSFTLSVGGVAQSSWTANQLPVKVSVPKSIAPTEFEIQLNGPAGFDLSRECEGPDTANIVRCSTQIVDLRPLCDPTVLNYIWAPARIVWESQCTGLIIKVEEVSPSDEDDGDIETHGKGSGRFRKIETNDLQKWITVEAICMGLMANVKNSESRPLCLQFQQNYHGVARNIRFSPVGTREALITPTGRDRNHGMHFEGHGLSYAFQIPDDPNFPTTPDTITNIM